MRAVPEKKLLQVLRYNTHKDRGLFRRSAANSEKSSSTLCFLILKKGHRYWVFMVLWRDIISSLIVRLVLRFFLASLGVRAFFHWATTHSNLMGRVQFLGHILLQLLLFSSITFFEHDGGTDRQQEAWKFKRKKFISKNWCMQRKGYQTTKLFIRMLQKKGKRWRRRIESFWSEIPVAFFRVLLFIAAEFMLLLRGKVTNNI